MDQDQKNTQMSEKAGIHLYGQLLEHISEMPMWRNWIAHQPSKLGVLSSSLSLGFNFCIFSFCKFLGFSINQKSPFDSLFYIYLGGLRKKQTKESLKNQSTRQFLYSCFLIWSITGAYFRNAYVAQLDSAPAF